ncbi:hypothetical protein B0H19DRAFT_1254012 [Mycena capillaripes]|nr:hypothetical protein B0H19DRAFT_1254012 [Mycena capillaripes]
MLRSRTSHSFARISIACGAGALAQVIMSVPALAAVLPRTVSPQPVPGELEPEVAVLMSATSSGSGCSPVAVGDSARAAATHKRRDVVLRTDTQVSIVLHCGEVGGKLTKLPLLLSLVLQAWRTLARNKQSADTLPLALLVSSLPPLPMLLSAAAP